METEIPYPLVDRIRHSCENILFPQLRWRAIIQCVKSNWCTALAMRSWIWCDWASSTSEMADNMLKFNFSLIYGDQFNSRVWQSFSFVRFGIDRHSWTRATKTLRFTSDPTPADLLVASMRAKLFSSTYWISMNKSGSIVQLPQCEISQTFYRLSYARSARMSEQFISLDKEKKKFHVSTCHDLKPSCRVWWIFTHGNRCLVISVSVS